MTISSYLSTAVTFLIATSFFFCLPINVAVAMVNINTATSAQLQTLVGIGPTYAQRIIDYRATHGPFQKIEDIQKVTGIGPATFEKIKNDITIEGETSAALAASGSASGSGGTNVVEVPTDEKKVLKPVGGLTIKMPDYGFVDQPVKFDVEPIEGTGNRLIRYEWNFGDGHTSDAKNPVHTYRQAGTYVVVVESTYLKEHKLERREIVVLPVKLALVKNYDGSLTLTNHSEHEIDLAGMKIVGGKDFTFEKYTLLLPGQGVTLGEDLIGTTGGMFVLQNQNGRAATNLTENIPVPSAVSHIATRAAPVSAVGVRAEASVAVESPTTISEAPETHSNLGGGMSAAASGATIPKDAWPYLGLLGIIGLGLFALYGSGRNMS